ncbi:MAG: hypothetical protein AAGF66_12990 [Cyanobacteria bacterium P01_H01_bin.119]
MTTHFITAEIDLSESTGEIQAAIAKTLENQGVPLRWAITQVDLQGRTATVEAVVTQPGRLPDAQESQG